MAVTIASLADKNGNSRDIAPKGLNHNVTFKVSGKVTGTATATNLWSGDGSNINVTLNTTSASIATSDLSGTIATSQIEDGAVTKAKLGSDISTDSVTDGSSKLLTSNGAYDNLVRKSGDTMTGPLNLKNPSGSSESQIRVYKPGDSNRRINLFYERNNDRGLWDAQHGNIVQVNDSGVSFNGNASTSTSATNASKASKVESSIYLGGSKSNSSTTYMKIGYVSVTSYYGTLNLLINHNFYNTQHYSSDLITIVVDRPNGGSSSGNVSLDISRIRLAGSVGSNNNSLTKFYYKVSSDRTKITLYAQLGSAGNAFGQWEASVLGGTEADVTFDWTDNSSESGMSEIPLGGKVGTANFSENAGHSTYAQNANEAGHAESADAATNALNATYANQAYNDTLGNSIPAYYGHNIAISNTNVLQLKNAQGNVINAVTLPYVPVVFNTLGTTQAILYCL